MIKYLRKHKNKLILFNTIFIAVFLVMTNKAIATENLENTISEDEIIKAQQENLNIDDFIQEADVYTENVYEDIDIGELFSSAITGNIDNENIFKSIINSVGGEVFEAISVLGSILVIIVIHSI